MRAREGGWMVAAAAAASLGWHDVAWAEGGAPPPATPTRVPTLVTPPLPVVPPLPRAGSPEAKLVGEPWVCIPGDDVSCSDTAHRVCLATGAGWGECVAGQPQPPHPALDLRTAGDPHIATWEVRSTGLINGGVALAVIGGTAAITGLVFTIVNDANGNSNDNIFPPSLATGLLVSGVVVLAGGIAMEVVGSGWKAVLSPPQVHAAGVSFSPTVGVSGAGFHGTF